MAGKDVEIVIGAKDLATRVLDGVNASTQRLQNSVVKASVIMTGAFAAFQTLKGVSDMFLEQVDAVDKLVTQSIKLGTTVNELEGYRFALESIANVDPSAADAMLTKLARTIGDAALKGEEADGAFKTLGLDLKSLANSSTTKAFETVVEALRKVENKTEQLALATKLFGRSGADLLPVIRDTAAAYDYAAAASKRLGVELSDIEIAQIQEADTALEEMQRAITGIVRSITVELVPAIAGFTSLIVDGSKELNPMLVWLKTFIEGWGLVAAFATDFVNSLTKRNAFEHGSAMGKYLDALREAELGFNKKVTALPPATTADVIASEAAIDIVTKKEAAEMAAVERIAEKEREEDMRTHDRFKKLQEDDLREIAKEKEAIQKSNADAARGILEDIDPLNRIKREIEEINELVRGGFLQGDIGEKAKLKLLQDDTEKPQQRQPLQAFESRLLTRVTTRTTDEKIAEHTKGALQKLKDIDAELKSQRKSSDDVLKVQQVGP